MKSQEVMIRIVGKLDLLYGNLINQEEVKKIIEEVLYDYEIGEKGNTLATIDNMDNMILIYLTTKRSEGLTLGTIKSYTRVLKKFADNIRKNVEDISTMDIRVYLINRAKTGIKNTTIANETNILRGFFNYLEDEEYVVRSPMRKIKSPKIEKRLRKGLTKEEFEMISKSAKTPRQNALLQLLYSTGCRLEEVEQMKKQDIDWERLRIRVIGKGDKERIVYFNDTCKDILRKYLMTRLDDCNAVFVTQNKPVKFLSRRSIQRELNRISKQSDLDISVYPHLIRHTFALHMLNKGMSLSSLQKILGHEQSSTTEIYAELIDSTVENEYRKYS